MKKLMLNINPIIIRFRVHLTFLVTLVFFTHFQAFTQITGTVQFLTNGQENHISGESHNYFLRRMASEDVSAFFKILDYEFDFSNIPICVSVSPDHFGSGETSYASTTTDKHGHFKVEVLEDINDTGLSIVVSVNGGTICKPQDIRQIRKDIRGSSYSFGFGEYSQKRRGKLNPIDVVLYVTLDGELLKLQRRVDSLATPTCNLRLFEILQRIDSLLGSHTSFADRFPISSIAIKDSIRSIAERNVFKKAELAFSLKNYESSLNLYTDLVNLLPHSTSYNIYVSKKELSRLALAQQQIEQQTRDSLRSYCDSLISLANLMPQKNKAIQFLEKRRIELDGVNPYWQDIETKIESLQNELDSEKKEADFRRLENADIAAIKKFKVDQTVNQADFFANPFAFKDKHILITCVVKKFESPTSAIMNAADQFFADFKIPPPKKLEALYLIVKVKGVTTLYNAFGTPIKVPYVDVVHILNLPPDNQE
jgi:hypothetical protein